MSFDLFFDAAAASRGLIFMNISSYVCYHLRALVTHYSPNARATDLFPVLVQQLGAFVEVAF